jgi:hypothetical protein
MPEGALLRSLLIVVGFLLLLLLGAYWLRRWNLSTAGTEAGSLLSWLGFLFPRKQCSTLYAWASGSCSLLSPSMQ